jgi:hypothetical protein
MPFARAHVGLLLLFPLTFLAFWRGYFSDLSGAPLAFHVHGVTASLWLGLLALQSWTIGTRAVVLHRAAGLGVFLVLPLFTAGGLLVMQTMAGKFAAAADPFNGAFGARLATVDLVAALAVPAMAMLALRHRRKMRLHGGYMLATVLFLLSPIIGRALPYVPGFPMGGLAGRHPFEVAFHLAQIIAIAAALLLYLRAPRHGQPFLAAALLTALQSVTFETLGRAGWWETLVGLLATIPGALLAALGIGYAALMLRAGWSGGAAARGAMRAA